jgi:hypothetical protein
MLTREWYEYQALMVWPLKVVQGIMFGNSQLTIALQAAMAMADMKAHAAHALRGEDEEWGYRFSQLVMFLLAGVLTRSFESLMLSEAAAMSEVKRSNRSNMLVRRLLSAMCECVVHLDSDLCIAEPCPKLASLLLRRPDPCTTLARPFVAFLPSVEQDRFKRHLVEEIRVHADEFSAYALHLNLLDANGLLVPVEVFSSFIQEADGSSFYLMGVKEEADVARRRDIGEGLQVNTPANVSIPPHIIGMERSIDEISRSNTSVATDNISILSDDLCTDLGVPDGAAAVWVDASTMDFDIVRCNNAFRCLGGPSSLSRPFCKWIASGASKEAMTNGVQTVTNQLLNGMASHVEIQHILLRPPMMSKSGTFLEVSAHCSLSWSASDGNATTDEDSNSSRDEDNLPYLRLVLTCVTQSYKKRNRTATTSRALTGTPASSNRRAADPSTASRNLVKHRVVFSL